MSIETLNGKKGFYQIGENSNTYVHDPELYALMREIWIEMQKMNWHLSQITGQNLQDYNIGGDE